MVLTHITDRTKRNLIENTPGREGCAAAHGLSFYVETKKHKLLVDLGPSEETLQNAKVLGVDLAAVDTVILSLGHYDHSGGIMPFSKINDYALIYMQDTAMDAYVEKYGKAPDLVVRGFHLMKKTDYKSEEIKEIEDSARELKNYPTQYVTCHCLSVFFSCKKTLRCGRQNNS